MLALEGRDFELQIKEKFRKVTNDQYGFYFGGILATCYESEMFSGFDRHDEIHDQYFSPKFLSYKVIREVAGKKYEIRRETPLSKLTVPEMTVFIEKVLAECAQLGIEVLSPQEYNTEQYKTTKE